MPGGIHHTVVIVRDLDASLRFYRDGLGLDLLADRRVEGDWPGLFGASPVPRDPAQSHRCDIAYLLS